VFFAIEQHMLIWMCDAVTKNGAVFSKAGQGDVTKTHLVPVATRHASDDVLLKS
jgi:hypothetical protein